MRKIIIAVCIAVLACFTLTACDSGDYKKAVKFMEEGDYQSAVGLLEGIPDYKDSGDQLKLCKDMIAAIESLTEKNAALDEAINAANTLVKDERKALDENLRMELETAVTTTKAEKVELSAEPVALEELVPTIEKYNSVDYTAVLEDLAAKTTAMDESIRKYELVNHPTEAYVIKCLEGLPNITGISAVTEDDDPNGNLNKAGGYTAQVYFDSDLVDAMHKMGGSIIQNGTEGGGSIEVYTTEEEAVKRADYLSAFDGSILSSGTHKVVGTVVVRVSDAMTATEQNTMEEAIINSLTKLE